MCANIRIRADSAYDDAIAATAIGDAIALAVDDIDRGQRIALVNPAKQVIGWFPPDDPYASRLLSGARYRATLRRVLRGRYGTRFGALFVEVTIEPEPLPGPTLPTREGARG